MWVVGAHVQRSRKKPTPHDLTDVAWFPMYVPPTDLEIAASWDWGRGVGGICWFSGLWVKFILPSWRVWKERESHTTAVDNWPSVARGGRPGGQQLNFESGSSGTRPGLESIEGGKYSMCPLLPFCFLATVCVLFCHGEVLLWGGDNYDCWNFLHFATICCLE